MPFEVGDEIMFQPNGQVVEGIVLDVGWYRTTIRSFEREVFVIPNAVFSKNTVLNVTRKMKEWRFYEYLCVRVQDVHKVNAIIQVRGVGVG
jgi:MscS family membrane protein